MVDGFFKEASKYTAGLLGISRFFKLLKEGENLQAEYKSFTDAATDLIKKSEHDHLINSKKLSL